MTIRALRFAAYGEPSDVLHLEHIEAPTPAKDRIRIEVHACGLNPADWALCRGLFKGLLPRGIGLDVAGVVDAIGEGVTGIAVGDRVLGTPDYAECTSAGAADQAILKHWAKLPASVDYVQAAALPMAIETAYRSLDNLRVSTGQTLLVHGAGTTIGYAAVQMAFLRGAKVIATAGTTYADNLRAFGAKVTMYGEGMVERIHALADGPVDLVLDTAPASGSLPDLVRAAGGDPKRVFTISDHASAAQLGVRSTFGEAAELRYDVFPEFARRAGEGTFSVPVAQTFPLEDWRAAMELSLTRHARGKLVLVLR